MVFLNGTTNFWLLILMKKNQGVHSKQNELKKNGEKITKN